MAKLSLKGITKVYPGGVQAVTDFNLDIDDKEFIILVGPSGCGKSTVLRMIAGLEEITDGTLEIDGKVVNDIHPKDRDIAMVFQNYALYPHMSVSENMGFSLRLRKVPADKRKQQVEAAARILDLVHLLDRKPKELSGGQRQRAAVGRAIVRDPKVFLFDEPLSNLDAKLRAQMRTEISKLHMQMGTTFVYVTHDQVEAMTMGTRIVVMKDGVIQQVDTPNNLYDRPRNLFVAGFIGSPQMNFLNVGLVEEDGRLYARYGKNSILLPRDKAAACMPYAGKEVVMGIRPEFVFDDPAKIAEHSQSIIEADVDVVEPLGSDTYLYLVSDGQKITARVEPKSPAKVGETMKFAVDASRINIFDKATEQVIVN
ncbi:MAG TPA: sn-glycerol-3-phosphate ABC transporter ATP-binding protein UgpC [Bacillota bacterium]|nr:sn-glycerol-3-phosphate ABC transporter ATP-binding protein UgpC [Bacillota bacterium]HOA15548.1 sn-glycerol-3-phosphate ABC transporter ATP-binding protein UgpC [Bacillota bacterium]